MSEKYVKNPWSAAALSRVRVTDPYCDEAMLRDVENMLKLDADRLLAGFRETAAVICGMGKSECAAFMKNKERYGGEWENSLIGGHTLGHYLTALAQAAVNPALPPEKRKAVDERINYLLESLDECQDRIAGTSYEGFLFGAIMPTEAFRADPALQFANVEKGLSDLFTESWVPWYTTHKLLTGLNAACALAGKPLALRIANRLALWAAARTEGWTPEVNATVLSIEYGGIGDCLYELVRINNRDSGQDGALSPADNDRVLAAAHRFDELPLYERISQEPAGALDGKHANTTIPKFLGAISRYETLPDEDAYLKYAADFFALVVRSHTYVTGGNSENEHFGADDVLDAERTHVNNETCNTHNMLKLARRLFAATGDKTYADYAACTLLNAILASQDHETGFTTYFQPMATGYRKVFNTLDDNFWCCTGTGYENFTKLQEGIFFEAPGRLAVCTYLSSELDADGYRVSLESDLLQSDTVGIKVAAAGDAALPELWLRIPDWINGEPVLTVGGSAFDARTEGGFLVIPADALSRETEITLQLSMGIRVSTLPDNRRSAAFLYGPYVLSARLGNTKMRTAWHGVRVLVPAEKAVESDVLTVTAEATPEAFLKNIEKYLIRRPGTAEFDLTGVSTPLTFTTHFDQYKENYGIYWTYQCN